VEPGSVVVIAYGLSDRAAGDKTIVIGRPGHALSCLRAGAYGYLSEPVGETQFRDLVHNAQHPASRQDDVVFESGTDDWITLTVRCKMQTLDRLAQWLREIEMDLAPEEREDIVSAIRELVANAIEHGASSDPGQTLKLSRIRTRRTRSYHIQDPGPGFSVEDLPHAAISNGSEQPLRHVDVRSERGIRPGGFGILLSRNLADELLYNEKGNEVLFIKYV
jgi:anti-sigma regulatory factor (Ser/Thr protein kinase)